MSFKKYHYKLIDLNIYVFQLIAVVIIDVLIDPPLAIGNLTRWDSISSSHDPGTCPHLAHFQPLTWNQSLVQEILVLFSEKHT